MDCMAVDTQGRGQAPSHTGSALVSIISEQPAGCQKGPAVCCGNFSKENIYFHYFLCQYSTALGMFFSCSFGQGEGRSALWVIVVPICELGIKFIGS